MDMPSDALASIQKVAANAALPEVREAGPGEVGPTTTVKDGSPLVPVPMPPDQVAQWWEEIKRAEQRVKSRETRWDILLKEYMPTVKASGDPESVKVNTHFRNVHTKMGQLFYRSPDITLLPKDPGPANNQLPNPMAQFAPPGVPPLPPLTLEDVISVKQAVLTDKLGANGVEADRLWDELLFDQLAWAGFGYGKVGYKCTFKVIKKPVMGPPPVPQMPGAVLGLSGPPPGAPMVPQLGPDGQPLMQDEKVPVHEEWYGRRISPKKSLWDADLKSTRFDKDAKWMGMRFYMSPKQAINELGLTEDEAQTVSTDDRVFQHSEDQQMTKPAGLVSGVEIVCKSSYYTDEVHPLAMHHLILIDGIRDRAVVWRPHPDQEFDPMTGRLTDDSLVGFPFFVQTTRDLADSAFVESDSAFTNSAAKELNTYRRQSVKLRDAAVGKILYDESKFGETQLQRLLNSEPGELIGVESGALDKGKDTVITTTAQVQHTRDDYAGAQMLQQDINETLGIGSNQAGVENDTTRTATEIATVDTASKARSDKELGRTVGNYLAFVRKVDCLLMRYATEYEYVHITGETGQRIMMAWNGKIVGGKWLYGIAPDSQLRADTSREFKLMAEFYNLAGKDPLLNRAPVLKAMCRMRGLDPAKAVYSDPAAAMAQMPHGGPGDVINQHSASNSGNRPNEPGAENKRQEQQKPPV